MAIKDKSIQVSSNGVLWIRSSVVQAIRGGSGEQLTRDEARLQRIKALAAFIQRHLQEFAETLGVCDSKANASDSITPSDRVKDDLLANPPFTKEEIDKADELIRQAFAQADNSNLSSEETWKKFDVAWSKATAEAQSRRNIEAGVESRIRH